MFKCLWGHILSVLGPRFFVHLFLGWLFEQCLLLSNLWHSLHNYEYLSWIMITYFHSSFEGFPLSIDTTKANWLNSTFIIFFVCVFYFEHIVIFISGSSLEYFVMTFLLFSSLIIAGAKNTHFSFCFYKETCQISIERWLMNSVLFRNDYFDCSLFTSQLIESTERSHIFQFVLQLRPFFVP